MEKVYLESLIREETGKEKIKFLRRGGFVPAIVYGKSKKSLPIKLNRSQLIKFLHAHPDAESMIITLKLVSDNGKKKSGEEEKSVLIKEIQFHPVSEDILHIDFNQISLTEAIKIKVPIEAIGEAVGVKQEGGVLAHILWELEIECLPTSIPAKIEVDVTNMKIGDVIQVKDLKILEGAKVLTDKESIVFTLRTPKKEEVPLEAAEAGAAPAEPEVIKKEKAEKEEEAGEAKPQEEASGKKEVPGKKEAPGKK